MEEKWTATIGQLEDGLKAAHFYVDYGRHGEEKILGLSTDRMIRKLGLIR